MTKVRICQLDGESKWSFFGLYDVMRSQSDLQDSADHSHSAYFSISDTSMITLPVGVISVSFLKN